MKKYFSQNDKKNVYIDKDFIFNLNKKNYGYFKK